MCRNWPGPSGSGGAEVGTYRITALTAREGRRQGLYCRNQTLDDCHALLVRTIPGGSLEQIIFRMDALHCLEKRGVYLFNPPKVVERTVDKYYTTSLLATAGLPTPPTVVTENYSEAMVAFAELGEDVVVKPLFGSLGRGMVRVTDPDTAHRVFRALDLGRYVYYLQQFVPHDNQDLRVFVLGAGWWGPCSGGGFLEDQYRPGGPAPGRDPPARRGGTSPGGGPGPGGRPMLGWISSGPGRGSSMSWRSTGFPAGRACRKCVRWTSPGKSLTMS